MARCCTTHQRESAARWSRHLPGRQQRAEAFASRCPGTSEKKRMRRRSRESSMRRRKRRKYIGLYTCKLTHTSERRAGNRKLKCQWGTLHPSLGGIWTSARVQSAEWPRGHVTAGLQRCWLRRDRQHGTAQHSSDKQGRVKTECDVGWRVERLFHRKIVCNTGKRGRRKRRRGGR